MITINFFNILATVINVLVLFLLVQKFLVKPVSNILEKRESLIKADFEEARLAKSDANDLKAKYEDSLKNAREESVSIVEQAKTNAQAEYDRIVNEADEKAKHIVDKAESDAALEKEQALKEVKTEIGSLIALAVDKIEGSKTSAQTDQELIEKFLADVNADQK